MIYNIIDRRKRERRWRHVFAVVQPTWHDNSCKDSDHIDPSKFSDMEVDYDERVHIPVHDAVIWAERLPFAVTLYLYDDGTENIEISFDAEGRRQVRTVEPRLAAVKN